MIICTDYIIFKFVKKKIKIFLKKFIYKTIDPSTSLSYKKKLNLPRAFDNKRIILNKNLKNSIIFYY